jgi:hypothetical protein
MVSVIHRDPESDLIDTRSAIYIQLVNATE